MMDRYSADAVRHWAACTPFGRDAQIKEEKIETGHRLTVKLWNVARFAEGFLLRAPRSGEVAENPGEVPAEVLAPPDRWLLSRLARIVAATTSAYECYDYATAHSTTERFFWHELADNYIEFCKRRLYDKDDPHHNGARFTLTLTLGTVLRLLAPVMPHVTDAIYRELFSISVHRAGWPDVSGEWEDDEAERLGEELLAVATAVRRFKTERGVRLGAEIGGLALSCSDHRLRTLLGASRADLIGVSRTRELQIGVDRPTGWLLLGATPNLEIAVLEG